MHDKIEVLVAYALLGITLALLPLWGLELSASRARAIGGGTRPVRSAGAIAAIFFAAGLALLALRGWLGPVSAAALLVAAFSASWLARARNLMTVAACFIALYVATTLPWWKSPDNVLQVGALPLALYCAAALAFAAVFGQERAPGGTFGWWLVAYAFPVLVFSFFTGMTNDDGALLTLWHHWGAYIGPAEALLSGVTVLRDIPLQYGLGPTLLIAGACGADCWPGMYFITGTTIFFFGLGIGAMALALCRADGGQRVLALCCCFAAGFLWTSYPPEVSTPLITPSTTGLRYLPAVALACYLFFQRDIEKHKSRTGIAHLLWAVGALWSPESAFYVTFVWWPYYLWTEVVASRETLILASARALGKLVAVAAIVVILFLLAFYLVWGTTPTLYGYLAYAINPPGPLPINPHGTVLFFVMATLLAALTTFCQLRTGADPLLLRRGFVVQLLSYATASYFLGRSHDNNVLNVLPFIVLVLLYALRSPHATWLRLATVGLIAAVIGWLPSFGWGAWSLALEGQGLLSFQGASLGKKLTWADPDTAARVERRFTKYGLAAGAPSDAGAALLQIQREYREPVTVLDYSVALPHGAANGAWSAIHGPANFPYIPSERRREFLARTAETLKRPGWLVVDRKFPADEWLADFATAYKTTDRLDFGSYYALRMVPKASLVSPRNE